MDETMIIVEESPLAKWNFPLVNIGIGEFGGWLVHGPSWMR
jgi:hypothetical protein